MARCEYNPTLKEPAQAEELQRETDCPHEAVISVGAKGQWHLCESCAALPEFNKFRSRRRLKAVGRNKP